MIWNKNKNYSYSDISSNRISTKFMRLKTLSLNEIVQTKGFEFFHNTLTLILCVLGRILMFISPSGFSQWVIYVWTYLSKCFLYNRIKIKNCSLHITGSFIYLVNIKTQILSDKTSLIVKTPTNREVTDLICHQPSLIYLSPTEQEDRLRVMIRKLHQMQNHVIEPLTYVLFVKLLKLKSTKSCVYRKNLRSI